MKKNKIATEIKRYLFMILGCFCYALSLRMFLIPRNIVGGGVSGAASLIEMLTEGVFPETIFQNGAFPAGIAIILLNLPILICGLKLMGWKFTVNCLITNTTLGLVTELLNIIPGLDTITTDKILSAGYGGILQGIGIGCFIKFEMSSGGTELLGRLTHHVFPVGSIATHIAVFDGIVVVLGAILKSGLENILYALIVIFLSERLSDMIVMGLSRGKLCYIITNKEKEISEFLVSHSPRGVTILNGEGAYTKTPKGVILTCIKSNQIAKLKEYVKQFDEHAFVIVTSANEVYGKGFKKIDDKNV